jgi:hypothetical protein
MADILSEYDSRAGWGVECLSPYDTCHAFRNEKVLVLILMDMHRCALTRAREYLNDRIGAELGWLGDVTMPPTVRSKLLKHCLGMRAHAT